MPVERCAAYDAIVVAWLLFIVVFGPTGSFIWATIGAQRLRGAWMWVLPARWTRARRTAHLYDPTGGYHASLYRSSFDLHDYRAGGD